MKKSSLAKAAERREAHTLWLKQRRIAHLASRIPDQRTLDSLLLEIPNRVLRRAVYEECYKPHIKLFTPVYEGEVVTYHRVPEYESVSG